MPHIVKKTYILSYIAFCLSAPFIFIFSDFEVTASNENYRADFSSTVTTTLSSSAVGDTFCTGDAVTFTASPIDANNYRFYINGILKQGPSALNTFLPAGALFNEDKIIVTLEKNDDTGTDLLTIFENKIEDPGRIYFKDESDGLEEKTICYGSNLVNLESHRAASVNGILLALDDTRYQWMSSSDNLSWAAIIGANQGNYTPPKLTATTFFRRDVINDLNGTVCRSQSNILRIEVEVELIGGTISPNGQTLCEGGISEELKVENGVTGRSVAYQWQKSLDNIVFTDIPEHICSGWCRI